MTPKRLQIITIGLTLSIFMASVEGTIISTAMPTIVSQLGGLSIYSWVFSIFMLTSTTTVPLYGKLSDIFGRKLVYAVSMLAFLGGSLLCGAAANMEQLIIFRAVQGLGAGGVLPMTIIIIGDLFHFEKRARLEGLFSGIWGVSAIIGPLIGGFLVDQISWHWVFWINMLPGLIALGLVWIPWPKGIGYEQRRPSIDYTGAALLTLGILSLLIGLDNLGKPLAIWTLGASLLMLAVFVWVEQKAFDPILPLPLFRDRLFTISILHGILSGVAMFGSLTYVPLFVQAVMRTNATMAGMALTPMSIAWTFASMLAGYWLLKAGYRVLVLTGMLALVAGAFFMAHVSAATQYLSLTGYLALMGAGMGLSIPAYLIAVQSSVRKSQLGVATSTLQFSRSIGGTLGVSILGAALSKRLAEELLTYGLDPSSVDLNKMLDPISSAATALSGPVRESLAGAVSYLFWISFLIALIGLLVTLFTPSGNIAQLEQNRAED